MPACPGHPNARAEVQGIVNKLYPEKPKQLSVSVGQDENIPQRQHKEKHDRIEPTISLNDIHFFEQIAYSIDHITLLSLPHIGVFHNPQVQKRLDFADP